MRRSLWSTPPRSFALQRLQVLKPGLGIPKIRGVPLGYHWGNIGVILGYMGDNGKENGNCDLGSRGFPKLGVGLKENIGVVWGYIGFRV